MTSRRAMVLYLLREAGDHGVTTSEFLQAGCGSRFGGRIFELREQGHVIEAEPLEGGPFGSFIYRLTRDAERAAGEPSRNDDASRLGGLPLPAGGSLGIPQDDVEEYTADVTTPFVTPPEPAPQPEQTRLDLQSPTNQARLRFMDYDEEAA